MPPRRLLMWVFVCCLLISSLLACDGLPGISLSGSSTDTTTADGHPLNEWLAVKTGIELRYEHWKAPSGDEDTVIITRVNPTKTQISIGYQPDKPLQLKDWQKQTNATMIVNGGYFDAQNQATALIISNGQSYGSSYSDCCGMFAIDSQGKATLQSLADQPYDPSEQLQQATQSRPLLVTNGKRTNFQEDSSTKRRTIVAMDRQGLLLFIVSPSQAFTLNELADLLQNSDLSLQAALNLDGGSSTGIYLRGGNQNVSLDPITTLPIVISVK
jgi:uncharacterized protein YigE (DUF2233 family)